MAAVCQKFGLKLLTYGSFVSVASHITLRTTHERPLSQCGGFLSSQWIGKNSPEIYESSEALTPSQRKVGTAAISIGFTILTTFVSQQYFDMISNWGSWADFQVLLETLQSIADIHGVQVANVAARWVLDHPEVGAVIVGTRLGLSCNSEVNLDVFSFQLTEHDRERLEGVALQGRTQRLFDRLGDCGNEYR